MRQRMHIASSSSSLYSSPFLVMVAFTSIFSPGPQSAHHVSFSSQDPVLDLVLGKRYRLADSEMQTSRTISRNSTFSPGFQSADPPRFATRLDGPWELREGLGLDLGIPTWCLCLSSIRDENFQEGGSWKCLTRTDGITDQRNHRKAD